MGEGASSPRARRARTHSQRLSLSLSLAPRHARDVLSDMRYVSEKPLLFGAHNTCVCVSLHAGASYHPPRMRVSKQERMYAILFARRRATPRLRVFPFRERERERTALDILYASVRRIRKINNRPTLPQAAPSWWVDCGATRCGRRPVARGVPRKYRRSQVSTVSPIWPRSVSVLKKSTDHARTFS